MDERDSPDAIARFIFRQMCRLTSATAFAWFLTDAVRDNPNINPISSVIVGAVIGWSVIK